MHRIYSKSRKSYIQAVSIHNTCIIGQDKLSYASHMHTINKTLKLNMNDITNDDFNNNKLLT